MKMDFINNGNVYSTWIWRVYNGIGFIAAYLMTEYRAKKRQMNTDFVFTLFLTSVVFGMLGAKLLFYMTMIDEIIANPKVILDEAEGFVVYGGIIGGILAGYVACRIKKQNFWKYFDLVMPAVALAQGFGRSRMSVAPDAVMGWKHPVNSQLHFRIQILHRIMWR